MVWYAGIACCKAAAAAAPPAAAGPRASSPVLQVLAVMQRAQVALIPMLRKNAAMQSTSLGLNVAGQQLLHLLR